MEEAGDQGSYVVTQCFLVKIKGCEVRVVGNQGRDNTNNCAWDTSSKCQGGQPGTLTLGPPCEVLTQSNRGRLVILFQFYI